MEYRNDWIQESHDNRGWLYTWGIDEIIKGIGKSLYRFLEKDIWDSVDVIGVTATSYQYNRLLKFYIEELGLQFNHALLTKRTHQ